MKQRIFFLWILLLVGCASEPIALLNGIAPSGEPVCLEDRANIPAFVEIFYATRDLTTEEGKIDYLFERVKNSHLTFIRNKVEYTGPQAAAFLRWKLGRMEKRHHIKINTAQDFVSEVVSGSRISGDPYTVILPDGSRQNFQFVLQNELDLLNECLKKHVPEEKASPSQVSPDAAVA